MFNDMEPQQQQQQYFNNHQMQMMQQQQEESENMNKMRNTTTTMGTTTTTRWAPTSEQIRILKELYYNHGIRSPTTEQIQRISAKLRQYGKIEGKNVFYWFQNHKARERQKKRLTATATASAPVPVPDLPGSPAAAAFSFSAPHRGVWLSAADHHHFSPSPGVVNYGYGSTSLAMERMSFMDYAYSGSTPYYPFIHHDKIHETLEEDDDDDEQDDDDDEPKTLSLFPINGGDHCHVSTGGVSTAASNGGGGGYYVRASLELSLNSSYGNTATSSPYFMSN